MSRIFIDQYTKEAAIDFANNEAELKGFKIGSSRWKNAFKEFVAESLQTMTVGRNPVGKNPKSSAHKYQIKVELYPDIFQSFANRAALMFVDQSGHRGVPIAVIQNRILSAVNNLVRISENGIVGVKNTTRGNRQGKIPNADMSEIQIPNKEEFATDAEFKKAVEQVIYRWIVRDVITDCVLESLLPFFNLKKEDVNSIVDLRGINLDEESLVEFVKKGRDRFIRALRDKVKPKMQSISYKKLVEE